jgi:hypothetical protein
MLYHKYYLTSLLLLLSAVCFSQTFCPPNIDFEQGSLANWEFYTGSCCPITTTTLSGPVPTRHVLTSGNALDPYGNFPIVAPYAGAYSLMLGNNSVGAEAERARYTVTIPSTPGNYILIYRYAVVFENPNHGAADQPRFVVSMRDAVTNQVVPCSEVTYVASSILPGFSRSDLGTNVYYKPWTVGTLDLTGYNGRTVYIDFASGDCAQRGHFGYGYVDMNCGLFEIQAVRCAGDPDATLNGPPGFMSYTWMTNNFQTVVGNTQVVQVPVPATSRQYAVITTPYPGFGCTDTFYTTVTSTPSNSIITAVASNDTTICQTTRAQLNVVATGNGPFTYSWLPAIDLTCTNCNNPQSSTFVNRSYTVTASDKYGCSSKDTVNISVKPFPTAEAGPKIDICSGKQTKLDGSGVGVSSYRWSPTAGLSNPNLPDPLFTATTSTTYRLIVSNGTCADTDYVQVNVTPTPKADAGNDTMLCLPGQYELQGSYTGTATLLRWEPASKVSSANALKPTWNATGTQTFYFTVHNQICADTDTVSIVVAEAPSFRLIPEEDIVTCKGNKVTLIASGGLTYAWYPSAGLSNDTIADPVLTVGDVDLYTVRMVDFCNRDTQMSVTVNSKDYMKMTLTKSSDRDCRNDEVILTAGGADEYLWQKTPDMKAVGHGSVVVKPEEGRRYRVTGVSATDGCQDSISIWVDKFGNGIAVPNAFSPNGDRVNDCFQMIFAVPPITYELHVFNRWGNEVFSSINHLECWDGKLNGVEQPEGVYVYYYKISTTECGDIFSGGNVTLIK